MIKILNSAACPLSTILKRAEFEADERIEKVVRDIISDVRVRGDLALLEYTKQFDGVSLTSLAVTTAEIDAAYAAADEEFLQTLRLAAENIREYHSNQSVNTFEISRKNGVVLGQRVLPLSKVGLYVPGGTAAYPSSVLMDVIPAKLAGVEKLVMVTPPAKDGGINPDILVAARVAGVDEIYKVGGAQAIAALAYGTETVPAVDKIVGPGNIFVATAKREVFGRVDIDMIAGPSEILVVADSTANPKFVAADMLSQAEHDRLATAVLVTDSATLAAAVADEIGRQLSELSRQEIAQVSIDNNGKIIVVSSIEEAVDISNALAPEHLELAVAQPFEVLKLVKNAGSVFLGNYTPEAVGDYFAGANHTLPTSGTARFSSPLSVYDFQKRSSYICYNAEALEAEADSIIGFALREGLTAHAASVGKRRRK